MREKGRRHQERLFEDGEALLLVPAAQGNAIHVAILRRGQLHNQRLERERDREQNVLEEGGGLLIHDETREPAAILHQASLHPSRAPSPRRLQDTLACFMETSTHARKKPSSCSLTARRREDWGVKCTGFEVSLLSARSSSSVALAESANRTACRGTRCHEAHAINHTRNAGERFSETERERERKNQASPKA